MNSQPDDLSRRLQRIYASIESGEEHDMTRLGSKVVETPTFFKVFNDFSGDLSAEQLENLAYSLVHNIANVVDHARSWARRNGKQTDIIDKAVKQSFEIRVMIDLSNNDKHTYPPRRGGLSGRSPKLVGARRILRMSTRPEKGSSVGLTFNKDGSLRILGDGSAKAILSGEVLDESDVRIGDLDELANQAIQDWELTLEKIGALQSPHSK